MGADERVPNELWLEILGNLDGYADRKALSDFSAASHTFRSLAFPLLFSKFHFTAYSTLFFHTLLPSPTKVDQLLERLAFWTSPEVAPFVRFCDIWATAGHYGEPTEWSFSTDTPYILLDALFERLTQFTGLERLHAHNIHFTQARVDILCRLPIIPFEFGIYGGSVALGEHIEPSPRALRVSDLALSYGGDQWLPLLDPEHLHSLKVDFDPRCIGRTDAIPFFPNLRILTATLHPAPSQNRDILSKFPAVRVLEIQGKTSVLSPWICAETLPVLPLLRKYTGPHQALSMLASAATLTHLRTSKCNHRDLIATLQGIGSNSIESFHMEFSQLGITTFNRLVELLPHLTELVIHVVVTRITPLFARTIEAAWELKEFNSKGDQIVDGKSGAKVRVDFRPSAFFLALSDTPLPSGLRRLAISWEGPADGQLSDYTVPAFDQLRDVLAERCPRLTWVFFHGHYFRFEWQITLGGMTVKEETATTLNKARRQSYRPEVFWQRRD